MLLTLSRSIILSLPARILNVLLRPGGDGNLLEQVGDILSPSNIYKGFTFSSFALTFTHLFLSNLVRYILGHSVATLLILESSRIDGGYLRYECRDSKRHLNF